MAIAWSDGCVRIVSPESNKQIHEVKYNSSPAEGSSDVSCLGWGSNWIGYAVSPSGTNVGNHAVESVLHQAAVKHSSDGAVDLPRELALLEIEGILPKLSLLPAGKKYVGTRWSN